jgi:hypothetical protein
MDNFLIFLLFVCIAIALNFAIINYEKQKIRQSAERHGWTVQNIAFSWAIRFGGGRGGPQYFDVDYTDEKGQSQSCTCRTALISGVEWDV